MRAEHHFTVSFMEVDTDKKLPFFIYRFPVRFVYNLFVRCLFIYMFTFLIGW